MRTVKQTEKHKSRKSAYPSSPPVKQSQTNSIQHQDTQVLRQQLKSAIDSSNANNDREQEIDLLQKKVEEACSRGNKYKADYKELFSRYEQLQQRYREMQAKVSLHHKQISELQNEKQDASQVREERISVQKQLELQKSTVSDLSEKLHAAQTSLDDNKSFVQEITSLYAELKADTIERHKHETLKQSHQELQFRNLALQRERNLLRLDNDALSDCNRELNFELGRIDSTATDDRNDMQEIMQMFASYRSQSFRSMLGHAEDRLLSKVDCSQDSQIKMYQLHRVVLEIMRKDHASDYASLLQVIGNSRTHYSDCVTELRRTADDLARLRSDEEQLQNQIVGLKTQIDDTVRLRAEVSRLQTETTRASEASRQIGEKLTHVTAANNALQEESQQ